MEDSKRHILNIDEPDSYIGRSFHIARIEGKPIFRIWTQRDVREGYGENVFLGLKELQKIKEYIEYHLEEYDN
jgi:hypothetical protein